MLTPRQQEVMEMIRAFQKQKGFTPTVTEMANHLGVKSRSMVQRILQALEEQGYLERVAGVKRNIRLLKGLPFALPRLGRIAAGEPIAAIASHGECVDLSQFVSDGHFVLEVKGDSMAGDHIQDGDMVICQQCERVEGNDIAVVLVRGEEATLKRLSYDAPSETVCLLPSNPSHAPKVYFMDEIQVQGRYLGLIRWHRPL